MEEKKKRRKKGRREGKTGREVQANNAVFVTHLNGCEMKCVYSPSDEDALQGGCVEGRSSHLGTLHLLFQLLYHLDDLVDFFCSRFALEADNRYAHTNMNKHR